jgi:hypothetical protein
MRPLTEHERELVALQRRNRGVLLPELAQLQLDQAIEEQQREAAEYASRQPIRPESPLDPESIGSMARRARESRRLNRHLAADPHVSILRPGPRSGPAPWDDNECIDKDAIGWG